MKQLVLFALIFALPATSSSAAYPIDMKIVTLEIEQGDYDRVLKEIAAEAEAPREFEGKGTWYEPYGVIGHDAAMKIVRRLLRQKKLRVSITESNDLCLIPNGPAEISQHDANRISQPVIRVSPHRADDGSIHVYLQKDGVSCSIFEPDLCMGPGPFRQRVEFLQTVILETDWNVPPAEVERKRLFGVVPTPRWRKASAGPRRLVLVTPVDAYADIYAEARRTGKPVVETARIEFEE